MRELKFNLKYIFYKKEFYIAIIAVLFTNLIHLFLTIKQNINFGNFAETANTAEYQFILNNFEINFLLFLVFIIPIFCSMILSDSSWYEEKNKITNILHNRINYRKNIVIRFILSILISFLIVFISVILNYFILVLLFGSGNSATSFYELPIYILNYNNIFLSSLRVSNPVLYVLALDFHVSLLISLLSAISYSLSFFIKQRIFVYFIPFLFIIGSEFLSYLIGAHEYSIARQLQNSNSFSVSNALTLYIVLFLIALFFLVISLFKKKETL